VSLSDAQRTWQLSANAAAARLAADSGHREHRDRRIVITPIGIMIGA